jgi:hypothetical protein
MTWGLAATGLAVLPSLWALSGCGESGSPRSTNPALEEVGAVYYTPKGPGAVAVAPANPPEKRYSFASTNRPTGPAGGGPADKGAGKTAAKKAAGPTDAPPAEGGPRPLSPRMQRLMSAAVVANLEKIGKPTKAHYLLCNAMSDAIVNAGSQALQFRPLGELMSAAYPYAMAKLAPNLKELTDAQVKDVRSEFDSRIKSLIASNQGEADELTAFVFGTDGVVEQNIFYNGLKTSETVRIEDLSLDSVRAAGTALADAVRPTAGAAGLDALLPPKTDTTEEPKKEEKKEEKKDGGAALGPVPDSPVVSQGLGLLLGTNPDISTKLEQIGKPKAQHAKLANAIGMLVRQAPGAKPQFRALGELLQATFGHVLARAAPTLPEITDEDISQYAARFKPILDDLVKSGLEMEALKGFLNGADGLTNDNAFYRGLDPKIANNKKFQDSGLTLEGLREASSMYVKVFMPYAKLAGIEGLGG